MLTKQRRMHPDISSFTNQYIYENKVQDHPSVKKVRQPFAEQEPFPSEAAVFVDLSQMGAYALKESSSDSRYNLFSALVALQLILQARKNGEITIGYVTPYRAQAKLVTTLIDQFLSKNDRLKGEQQVVAATVHKFQGSERDLVIYDIVDSYPQTRPSILLTDKDSEKLLNVALTRAKGKLIYLADKKFIQSRTTKANLHHQLIQHLEDHRNSYTRHQLVNQFQKHIHSNLKWFVQEEENAVIKDLKQAKKVVISVQDPKKIEKYLLEFLRVNATNIEIILITPKKENIPLKSFRMNRHESSRFNYTFYCDR